MSKFYNRANKSQGFIGTWLSSKILVGCASVLNTYFIRSMGLSGSCAKYKYFIVSAKKNDSIRSSIPLPGLFTSGIAPTWYSG